MSVQIETKAAVTVAEMARMCGLLNVVSSPPTSSSLPPVLFPSTNLSLSTQVSSRLGPFIASLGPSFAFNGNLWT